MAEIKEVHEPLEEAPKNESEQMQEHHDDNTISINGAQVKVFLSICVLLGMFASGLFAFSNKADREEIKKTREYFDAQLTEMRKTLVNQRAKIIVVQAKNSAIYEAVKEIKIDLKELRKYFRRQRK